jgi:hypothetical protein
MWIKVNHPRVFETDGMRMLSEVERRRRERRVRGIAGGELAQTTEQLS